MRFTDIRARITEGMKFKEYIMWVSETDKKGVYAYEEVQPLVRCKDCQYGIDGGTLCDWFFINTSFGVQRFGVRPNGFCAWASKRDGE